MSGLHPSSHGLDQALGGGATGVGAVTFRLNGAIDLVTPSTANTYAGDGIFDGQFLVVEDTTFDSITLYQRLDGVAGTTTVELYHFTGGAWVEVALSGALSLTAGGGANASITRTLGPLTVAAGERLGVQVTAVQSRTPPSTSVPTDLVATVYEAP